MTQRQRSPFSERKGRENEGKICVRGYKEEGD